METWKWIEGWEGYYQVSDEGRVRRPKDSLSRYQKELIRKAKPCLGNSGYLMVMLKAAGRCESRYIHLLVCEAFNGRRPDGAVCCHNDSDLSNNRADNLRWDSREGNEADKVKRGTTNRGERHGLSKLGESDALEVLWLASSGIPLAHIAEAYGVSAVCVSDIKRRRRWRHLDWPDITFPPVNLYTVAKL